VTRPSEEIDLKLSENINTRNTNKFTAFWGKEGYVALFLNHPVKVGENLCNRRRDNSSYCNRWTERAVAWMCVSGCVAGM